MRKLFRVVFKTSNTFWGYHYTTTGRYGHSAEHVRNVVYQEHWYSMDFRTTLYKVERIYE